MEPNTKMTANKDKTEYGYCHCGCGQKTKVAYYNCAKRGIEKGKPTRYLPGHNRKNLSPNLDHAVCPITGCWEWQGVKIASGYGIITVNTKKHVAHRFYYEHFTGRKIKKGFHAHHACSNRACVNPEHIMPLRIGVHVRKTAATKLDWDQVLQIRHLWKTTRISRKEIAAQFGISAIHVYQVITERSWKTAKA